MDDLKINEYLTRQKDVRQTRLVSSMLSGHSPEFFSYFDLKCPLTSTYDTVKQKTKSLAEQLEIGHITFEVWTKFVDQYDKVTTPPSDTFKKFHWTLRSLFIFSASFINFFLLYLFTL
jgi:hypothetical protein